MIDVPFLPFIFHHAVMVSIRQLTDSFGVFSQHAGPVAVTAAWQGVVLACGLAICLRLAPRASAAHRFAIWAAGFGALVCLPFLPLLMRTVFSFGLAQGVGSVHSFVPAHGATGPLLRLDPRWSLLLGGLWIAGSVTRAVFLGVHSVRLRRLWNSAIPVEDLAEAEGLFAGGLPRGARIYTTKELDRPAVIGFFAPRILIPDWLYAKLTRDELEHVVLHECEHLRRRDDWINLAQKLCLVLFPLNPALVWMERRLCSERESACDDGVVRATQAPRAYAACLASLAERGLEHRLALRAAEALSLGAWQRRSELVHRVHRILRRTPGLGPVATTALLGTLSFGLLFGSVEFARCPQLVAFVPAPQVIAQQNAAVLGDARFVDAGYGFDKRNAAAGGFRAIDTVAHVPAANAASSHGTNGKRNSAKQSQAARGNTAATPHEVLLKAEIPASHSAAADSGSLRVPAQWIIFTTWEQVQMAPSTAKHDPNVQQDYDTESAADQTTTDSTVQHLILKIYPAMGAGIGIASPSDPSYSTSGTSQDQPAAIPLRDGWFVFQL